MIGALVGVIVATAAMFLTAKVIDRVCADHPGTRTRPRRERLHAVSRWAWMWGWLAVIIAIGTVMWVREKLRGRDQDALPRDLAPAAPSQTTRAPGPKLDYDDDTTGWMRALDAAGVQR